VWARWLEHDPIYAVERYADNLRRLRLIYMDCGSRDEANLHFGARVLSRKLDALGIEHTYEEFDDGHRNIQYRYSDSLPRLAAALQSQV
jgi:enterochelin esterase family protein